MIQRHLAACVAEALADNPVVLLHGARQTGKSTLVQWLAAGTHPAQYLTLDDASVLAAAAGDPVGFIAGLQGPVALDEVQRVPGLFPAIKAAVDRDRRPGRFLLTGSADVLLVPRMATSLVGRVEILTLWPFSQGELAGRREGFVDALFADELPAPRGPEEAEEQLWAQIVRGGYPEAWRRESPQRRRAWFSSYVTTILHRDVRDLSHIEGWAALPRLLQLIAARATTLLNAAELSRSSGLPQGTLKRYLALLEATFLVQTLPAWSSNLGKRLVRSRKLLLSDTGLAAQLLGVGDGRAAAQSVSRGLLLEDFVIMEVRKQVAWSQGQPQLFHFRTHAGREVDLVLENAGGQVVGVEVKAAQTIRGSDFAGLRALAEQAGERWRRGVVLYTGREWIPFGENLHAAPVSALWS